VTSVTSHPPWRGSLFHVVIIMPMTSYFDVVLCPSSSQILATPLHQEVTFSYYTDLNIAKFHSPVSPDPLNARSHRSLGFPKSSPLKNPRSVNGHEVYSMSQLRYCDEANKEGVCSRSSSSGNMLYLLQHLVSIVSQHCAEAVL